MKPLISGQAQDIVPSELLLYLINNTLCPYMPETSTLYRPYCIAKRMLCKRPKTAGSYTSTNGLALSHIILRIDAAKYRRT